MGRLFRTLIFGLLFLALCVGACFAADGSQDATGSKEPIATNTLCQVSTIQALLNGHYDGTVSFGSLMKSGDFGIGTFDKLDGEMIAFDGDFYQVAYSGQVNKVKPNWSTPFAVVTKFESDLKLAFRYIKDLDDLKARIKKALPGLNIFYALRIDGFFQYVKTRSVPAQKKPYPPLAEVAKKQSVFEITDTMGTMVGFYTPEFGGKINVPGFHFHFLDQSASKGGHVLDISTLEVVVQVDRTPYLFLNLPLSTAGATLKDRTSELDAIEK